MTGRVCDLRKVSTSAKRNSFQAKITQTKKLATKPGLAIGKAIFQNTEKRLHPSTNALFSISNGTARKASRIIHTASGRLKRVYARARA